MKGRAWLWGFLSLVLLTGCRPVPAELSSEIMSTESPSSLELCQEVYTQFLQPHNRESRESTREAESGYRSVEEYYSISDLDGDCIPELVVVYWEFGRYYVNLYAFEDNAPHLIGTFCAGRNGPHLYTCPGKAALLADLTLYGPEGTNHTWRKVTWKGHALTEEEVLDELIPWEEDALDPAPAQAPAKATDLLPDARPLELLPLYPPLEPWQAAYCDILLYPERYEEFYAVAEHIPSDNSWRPEGTIRDNAPYYFAISDLNGNGIPELLLGQGFMYHTPAILLNILRWNGETEMAEDMDGPRTYPLMDTLAFFDTGYFSTMNGAGGLYTEYWRLEEDDPDRYWFGYQRPYDYDYDGLKTTEIISFYGPDGEEFTLQEYYQRMGEKALTVQWQEATEENIHQAFLPPIGKEEP